MRVELGRRVAIEYRVLLESGEEVDASPAGEPLWLICGLARAMPWNLELALVGLETGQSRSVTLPPEQAYGERVEEAVREVDPAMIPAEAHRLGAALIAEDGYGGRKVSRVVAVEPGRIVVDHNHPLAGRTLTFEVTVVEIGEMATAAEGTSGRSGP
ncbi:FKBP-type peptidyl-prolyl cis-trans isomerase [Endothiovibrio diazotrophicus]